MLPWCRSQTSSAACPVVTGSSDATCCDQSQELDQYAAEPEVHKYLHSRWAQPPSRDPQPVFSNVVS